MKKLLLIVSLLMLVACEGEGGDSFTSNKAPNPDTETEDTPDNGGDDDTGQILPPTVEISAQMKNKSLQRFKIAWDINKVPKQWTSYLFCAKNDEMENNCQIIRGGGRESEFFVVIGSEPEDITLEHIFQNQLFMIFFAKDNLISKPFPISFPSDELTKLIQYLKADNTRAGDKFGHDIALDAEGIILMIGAPNHDVETASENVLEDAGAVYLYERFDGVWLKTATLNAPAPAQGNNFGHKVAIDNQGTILAVASPNAKPTENNTGVIDVFTRKPNQNDWTYRHTLTLPSNIPNRLANLELAISGSGKQIVASIDNHTSIAIFQKPSNDIDQAWSAPVISYVVSEKAGEVGYSIAINKNGSIIIVGAPKVEAAGSIFMLTGENYTNGTVLSTPKEIPVGGRYGHSVSLSDTYHLAVGSTAGKVVTHKRPEEQWMKTAVLAVPAQYSEHYHRFGQKVVMSKEGEMLAVSMLESPKMPGILGEIVDQKTSNGAVFLYSLLPDELDVANPNYRLQNSFVKDGINFGHDIALSQNAKVLVTSANMENSASIKVNGDETNTEAAGSGAAFVLRFK